MLFAREEFGLIFRVLRDKGDRDRFTLCTGHGDRIAWLYGLNVSQSLDMRPNVRRFAFDTYVCGVRVNRAQGHHRRCQKRSDAKGFCDLSNCFHLYCPFHLYV